MAKKALKSKVNMLPLVSLVALLAILISVFVLSGSFSNLNTIINQSKASQVNPKITESFSDAFKDGKINDAKWAVTKSSGVTIAETALDNLRTTIPSGATNNKARSGSLTFKELLKGNGDFRAIVVLYRPTVTGDGMGVSGIKFSSKGVDDDEAASVQWRVNGANSTALFYVNGADGTRLETEQKNVAGNIAMLRLDRVNKKYRAYFKLGKDATGDTDWIALGEEVNATLGNEGWVSVFTNNAGSGDNFPKVIGRMDSFHIGWEGDPATRITFSDAFANGVLGKNWNIHKSSGVQVSENTNDNLIMSLASGSVDGKPRYARIVRTMPVVPEHKDFAFAATFLKPSVVGEGSGYSGLGFVSTGNVDDEGASVRWIVSGSTVSRVVFTVRAPDGTLSEKASVNLASNVNKLTLRLARNGDRYSAHYRTGDSDTDLLRIGSDESSNFGAAGRVMLEANNIGAGNKFPRVVGRVDQVWGSVEK